MWENCYTPGEGRTIYSVTTPFRESKMGGTEQPDEIVFWDEPCPQCRSSLRYVKCSEPGKVFCDACGYVEGEEE
jgi:formamidopyrimidine-DNA glycosylase